MKSPVAAQKTTVYVGAPPYEWIATTNSEIVGRPENKERDEARAKEIAAALNYYASRPDIYKIRYIVQETKRGRDRRCVDVKRIDEKVIYGNLARAKEIYQEYLNDAQGFEQYSKYFVILELFVPHIHENGELAYWPDGGSYIEQHRTRLFRG